MSPRGDKPESGDDPENGGGAGGENGVEAPFLLPNTDPNYRFDEDSEVISSGGSNSDADGWS